MTDMEFNKKLYDLLSTEGVVEIIQRIDSYSSTTFDGEDEIETELDITLKISIPNQPELKFKSKNKF